HLTDLPEHRFFAGELGCSPRSNGEWTIKVKVGGWIVPVLDIRPPVPRERATDLRFDGVLKLASGVHYGRVKACLSRDQRTCSTLQHVDEQTETRNPMPATQNGGAGSRGATPAPTLSLLPLT